ncbi:MAG: hypothetical protein V4511_00805 [Bacteroidota bacterium]
MKQLITILAIALIFTIFSCEKPAGEGGNSSIKGNVWGQNWNSTFTLLTGEGPAVNIDVFIIYGSETSYGDKISTSPDGTFEFKYLRPGKYKVYVYSKTSTTNNPNGKVAVSVDVEITKKKQTLDVGKITVNI